MAVANLGSVVAEAWEQALRESPDPLRHSDVFCLRRRTYRERLDEVLVNCYGERIPQIVLVRRNLRRLGKARRPPRLPA